MAELAAAKGSDSSRAQLQQIYNAGAAGVVDGRIEALPQLNTDFHEHLAAMADNQLLAEMLNQLASVVRWIYAERIAERVNDSWGEHADIAKAVVAGDAALARRLAVAHVCSARDAFFADQSDSDSP